ncbi:unnamed protein product [Penicillium glandicola]
MSEHPKPPRKGSLGGLMDRMLHRDHHQNTEIPHEAKDAHEPHEDDPKKEADLDKFKDYVKKDEEVEKAGRTYADLM